MTPDDRERDAGEPRRATPEDIERLTERLARGDEDDDAVGRAFDDLPFAERSEEEPPPPDELKP